MIYLLLLAGLFMGWSEGTNGSASAFGTAVSSRVIKYRTAIILVAVMIMIGAALLGDQNISKLSSIAENNKVTASFGEVTAAMENGTLELLKLKSALKAAIIFICGAVTVFGMSYLKLPVSANQAITGAVIGWGICYADYSNPEVKLANIVEIAEFASTWLINPLGSAIISFVLVFFVKKFLEKHLDSLRFYDKVIKIGYFLACAFAAFSIGQNTSASVTAFYYDPTGYGANLLTSARLTAVLGGAAIALGVLTYSKKVMMTVGNSIAEITQIDGFLVVVAMTLTVLLMGKFMGIPVSISQSVVGAVMGAGLVNGVKKVNFGVLKNIAIAWISSPTIAGILAYIIAVCTKSYFGA